MELLYTILFTNFIFLWFSKYNFFTCILLLFFLNTIRNVRIYLVNNNINNSTNPFLNGINNLFNGVNWITSKISNGNSYLSEKIPFINYLNNKYFELNNHFLEIFRISKKQIINQFTNKFNYSIMDMQLGNSLIMNNPNQFGTKNIISNTNFINEEKKTNKEITDLNNEYKKRNAILINLNNQIMPTLNNIISSFDKIKNIDNKKQINTDDDNDISDENSTKNKSNKTDNISEKKEDKNIYLYDSDEDCKKNN
jgi:hypothetical protein